MAGKERTEADLIRVCFGSFLIDLRLNLLLPADAVQLQPGTYVIREGNRSSNTIPRITDTIMAALDIIPSPPWSFYFRLSIQD